MSLIKPVTVELGEICLSSQRTASFLVSSIGTGVACVLYDKQSRIGGIAYVILPDSKLAPSEDNGLLAKYCDLAVPELINQFEALGGKKETSTVRLIGGAQLFNFGGGSGNLLNIGTRNATTIRATMARNGLLIEKADTGGNKAKTIRFQLGTGEIVVQVIGGKDYII